MKSNNVSFDNVYLTQADLRFGEETIGYLIAEGEHCLHAISYYHHMNNLFLALEGICDMMKAMNDYPDGVESVANDRLFLQDSLLKRCYIDASLALSMHVAALLDEVRVSQESWAKFETLSLILRGWCAHCFGTHGNKTRTKFDMDTTWCLELVKGINSGGIDWIKEEIQKTIAEAQSGKHYDVLGEYADAVNQALSLYSETTSVFVDEIVEHSEADPSAINSYEYMLFTGHLCAAWMLLKQGISAHVSLLDPDITDENKSYMLGKLSALDYFCNYELVKSVAYSRILRKNPQILNFTDIKWLAHDAK